MLTAKKARFWGNRYEISVDGRVLTTLDRAFWRSGGDFELNGRRYHVRGPSLLGRRFEMLDVVGVSVASAERLGRRRWTVTAGGVTYEFQRKSVWSGEQQLLAGGRTVGEVRQTSFWRSDVMADLPGMPLPVQVFVLAVVITMWDNAAAAA